MLYSNILVFFLCEIPISGFNVKYLAICLKTGFILQVVIHVKLHFIKILAMLIHMDGNTSSIPWPDGLFSGHYCFQYKHPLPCETNIQDRFCMARPFSFVWGWVQPSSNERLVLILAIATYIKLFGC